MSQANNIKLSVVIPAYNEAKNIQSGVLDQVDRFLSKQKYSYEVLIVDDGSKDNTVELAQKEIKNKKGFKVIRNPHGGKALTVISGMLKAQGEIAVFTDMDQATPLNQIEKFIPKFEQGFEIVIGSRKGRKGAPALRKLSAWGFAILRNIILGLPFTDTQCGFKAFTNQVVKQLFPKLEEIWKSNISKGSAVNAGFDIEMLFLAKRMGFKIAEIPVDWQYVGTERVQVLKDATEAIKDMFRIRIKDFGGEYVKTTKAVSL